MEQVGAEKATRSHPIIYLSWLDNSLADGEAGQVNPIVDVRLADTLPPREPSPDPFPSARGESLLENQPERATWASGTLDFNLRTAAPGLTARGNGR